MTTDHRQYTDRAKKHFSVILKMGSDNNLKEKTNIETDATGSGESTKTGRPVLFYIYAVLIAFYPMINVARGLSTLDTTYSPGNFLFHGSVNGTWVAATYLANALGHLFTFLPFGDTLLGMNIYTSLLVSTTAVASYCALSGRFGIHAAFVGEIIAVGLCWCPTTILYNYLTYLLMTAAVLLILKGIGSVNAEADSEDGSRTGRFRPEVYLFAAGCLLGSNVLTRFPNITEAAFILIVWLSGLLVKSEFKKIAKQTLVCIAGYVAGFGVWFIVICIRFGISAYPDMIKALFAMTDTATDYKPYAMIEAFIGDYEYAAKWIALWCVGSLACLGIYHLSKTIIEETKTFINTDSTGDRSAKGTVRYHRFVVLLCLFTCLLIFAVIIRIFYGQGMFSFRYFEYGSMYFWAVLMLFITTLICIWELIRGDHDRRVLGLTVLLVMYITCLGSNNGLYPSVNNLFIVAPFFVGRVISYAKRKSLGFSLPIMILAACVLIQSVGFAAGFAFDDGTDGTPRDSYVTGYDRTAHIKTTAQHAKDLQGLMDFIYGKTSAEAQNHIADTEQNTGLHPRNTGRTILTYGDIPGLGYILDMPPALTTYWPDLDSYNYYEWEDDLARIGRNDPKNSFNGEYDTMPVVIVTLPVAAWIEADGMAAEYFGVDRELFGADRKLADLAGFISAGGYSQVYANDAYVVYDCK